MSRPNNGPRPAVPLPTLHKISAIAAKLDVSTKTVRRWIESGTLPAHRLGRQIRVSDADLADFLMRCREF
jgi:excisionase family DNA binding protein